MHAIIPSQLELTTSDALRISQQIHNHNHSSEPKIQFYQTTAVLLVQGKLKGTAETSPVPRLPVPKFCSMVLSSE